MKPVLNAVSLDLKLLLKVSDPLKLLALKCLSEGGWV